MFNQKDNEKKEELATNHEIKEIEEENKKLFLKLTNKNQDYFVQLNRHLDELDCEKEKKIVVLNEMILETIDFQEEAITARKMYGTVSERAEKILVLDSKLLGKERATSSNKMLYMDGALLLGGMLTVVNGFFAWRSLNMNETGNLNLVQLVMNFVLGGMVALVLTKYKPIPGKSKGIIKYIGATLGAMILFVFIMVLAEMITPSFINLKIPPLLFISIGLIAIALRQYLKKKFDIKGTLI